MNHIYIKNLRFYNKSNQTPFSWINKSYADIIEKIKTSNLKIDPETGLTGFQKSGKSRSGNKNPGFKGYYVTPLG